MATRRGFLGGSAAALLAGAAPRIAWAHTEADVVVIGAGLAGLNAARILEAAGAKVIVIEGTDRIGGRLHTLDDLPGAPDAGGIQVGAGYARLRTIAQDLGVAMLYSAGAGAGRFQVPGNLYNIGGLSVPSAGWSNSSANQLSEAEHDTEPASLLGLYSSALPSLESPQAWLDASPDLDRSVAAALKDAGASAEARRLIHTNFNGGLLEGMSQLHLARSFAIFRAQPGPWGTIAGGSQRLPEAMAQSLTQMPRLGERVDSISEDAGGVSIRTDQGELRARHAICTIPFAALRSIVIESPLAPSVAGTIGSLPYTRASFAFLSAKTPFWREDGMPDTLWTDDPLIGRVFVLGDDPAMLKLWTTGAGADLLDRMAPDEAARAIISRIEEMRPAAKGQLEVQRFYSWQRSPFARGIYHHIGTGMARRLADATRYQGKRLHFAGEHLAQASSGMEGALESGERAGQLVASRL